MKYFFLILLSALPLRAQDANGKRPATWAEQTNILWSATGQPKTVNTKERAIRFKVPPQDSFDIRIVAVVDGVTGNEWVGKKTDLYVETRSGIVGISLPHSGILIWDRGLMSTNHPGETVDELVRRFEVHADFTQLIKVYDPVTDLRPILDPSFFGVANGSATDVGGARISHYQLTAGKLELHIESRAQAHTATVWIDLEKRTVIKAIQDGKQIAPNEGRQAGF